MAYGFFLLLINVFSEQPFEPWEDETDELSKFGLFEEWDNGEEAEGCVPIWPCFFEFVDMFDGDKDDESKDNNESKYWPIWKSNYN